MYELVYCVNQYSVDGYLYSVHCGIDVLDEVIRHAHENGYTVKVSAYYSNKEVKEVK